MPLLGLTTGSAFKSGLVSSTVASMGVAPFDFNASLLAKVERATIGPRKANVMFTYVDGAEPASDIGYCVADRGILVIDGNRNINNLRWTREASTDLTLSVTLEFGKSP